MLISYGTKCSFTILPYDLRAISGVALQIDESFVPLLRRMFCLSLVQRSDGFYERVNEYIYTPRIGADAFRLCFG